MTRVYKHIDNLISFIIYDFVKNDIEDMPCVQDFVKLQKYLKKWQTPRKGGSCYITFYQWNIRKDDRNRYHLYQGEL